MRWGWLSKCRIGDFVVMNMNCAIGHNCSIGQYSSFSPGVNLGGFTIVEDAVEMGIGASTKQFIKVGNNAIVGGNAMLVKNVSPNTTVVGVPAKSMLNDAKK
jgi:acyl-[acyl carrier protein]--UDP-N-acetylglucosamine O-acyltransferase